MSSNAEISLAEQHFNKAFQFQVDGEIEEAIKQYKASIDIYPTAKAHTYLGEAYSLQGKYTEAIEECKKAIGIDPNYAYPFNDIGNYLLNLGEKNKAIIWFEKAIRSYYYKPKHFPLYSMGKIFEDKGEWFEALKCYNRSLLFNPDYDPAQDGVIRMAALLN